MSHRLPLASVLLLVLVTPRGSDAQAESWTPARLLIIGYGFMRHYVVTFDYPNRLVTFERPAGANPRPPAP